MNNQKYISLWLGKILKLFPPTAFLVGFILLFIRLSNLSEFLNIIAFAIILLVLSFVIYKAIPKSTLTLVSANKKLILNGFKLLLTLIFAYFFWLMLKLTLEYIPAKPDISFLQIKQTEVHARPEYLTIFYIHVYTSIFVLLSGFVAINRWSFKIQNFHRTAGKIYVFLILLFSAPSGFYMGIFANGGFYSILSFVILGALWWVFTFKAFRYAVNKNFKKHQYYMWRSFALTLSAITLRFWKVTIVYFFHPNPMDVYLVVAWLGWVLNLLFVELLILKKSNTNKTPLLIKKNIGI